MKIASLLALAPLTAFAQSDELGEIIVRATKPGLIENVSSEEAEDLERRDLAEALTLLPGVSLQKTGARAESMTAYSLAELNPSFGKQNIIVADQVDGKPLDEFEGSRMVVAGDDLRHSRWIRQVKQIILTHATPPAP